MLSSLKFAAAAALRWLAPDHCAACDAELAAGAVTQLNSASTELHELFCPACVTSFASVAEPPGAAEARLCNCPVHALGRYDGPLQQAIVRFKYQNSPTLARGLSSALFAATQALSSTGRFPPLPRLGTLVPVPIHPARLAERGYNQAALLAVELAKLSGLPCDPHLLRRRRLGPRQAELTRQARLQNMCGQIEARRARQSIVLVDDVLTTGSTMRACATAIRQGGGTVTQALTLAWTPST